MYAYRIVLVLIAFSSNTKIPRSAQKQLPWICLHLSEKGKSYKHTNIHIYGIYGGKQQQIYGKKILIH